MLEQSCSRSADTIRAAREFFDKGSLMRSSYGFETRVSCHEPSVMEML